MNVLRALACVLLAVAATPGWALISDLDTSFGSGGTARHNLGTNNDFVSDITVDDAGRIYLLAYQYDIQNGGAVNDRSVITRLTSGGALDTSFGSNGKITISRSTFDAMTPYGLFVDAANQRIYLLGAHLG
ncbi:MAG TPA: hypothetical protein VFV51_03390, partial [Vicinamibacterales bacterium]|nr:hypothetical protein [Vicinamibacterales bacterium]